MLVFRRGHYDRLGTIVNGPEFVFDCCQSLLICHRRALNAQEIYTSCMILCHVHAEWD